MKRDINNLPFYVMVCGAVICGIGMAFVAGCFILGMIITASGYKPPEFMVYAVTDGMSYILPLAGICAAVLFISVVFVSLFDFGKEITQKNDSQ